VQSPAARGLAIDHLGVRRRNAVPTKNSFDHALLDSSRAAHRSPKTGSTRAGTRRHYERWRSSADDRQVRSLLGREVGGRAMSTRRRYCPWPAVTWRHRDLDSVQPEPPR
jgi:hypothetical protein